MTSVRARAFRALIRVGTKSIAELTIEERRARLEKLASRAALPRKARVRAVDAGGVPSELITVPRSREDITILYLHGGAFCVGSPKSHRSLVARICSQSEARALVPAYRLAPEHVYPAAVNDAYAALLWVAAEGKKINVDTGRIAVAGDSAGGNLAAAVCLMARDKKGPAIAFQAPVHVKPLIVQKETIEPR